MVKRSTTTFTFGNVKNCHFMATRYRQPNNLALAIEGSNNEQIAICSVNPREFKGDDVLCVKDWSENEGMVDFLVKQEIITANYDWFNSEESGFVVINAYPLTDKGKELFKGV